MTPAQLRGLRSAYRAFMLGIFDREDVEEVFEAALRLEVETVEARRRNGQV